MLNQILSVKIQDVGKTSTLSINAPFDCGIEKAP